MKKMRWTILLLTLCMVLSIPAMAAESGTETERAAITVKGTGAAAVFNSENDEIIDVTVSGSSIQAGKQYLIMMVLIRGGEAEITEDSILYLDQTAAADDGSVSFRVYPSDLTDSVIYVCGAEDGLTKIAIVEGKYILGDVDGDGEITGFDATCVLRRVALLENKVFDEQAADTDQDGEISGFDAVKILRYVAFEEKIEKKTIGG